LLAETVAGQVRACPGRHKATASAVPGVRRDEGYRYLSAGAGRNGGYSQRPDDHRNRSLAIGHQ